MNIPEYIDLIEQQGKEQDGVYHRVALKFGLSDTSLWILYMVAHAKEDITQQDLCRSCFFPKQTINTTIANLIKSGHVMLESMPGTRNAKRIILTEKGAAFAQQTVKQLRKAEIRAYGNLTEQELNTYLELTCKLTHSLREETEQLCI